MVQHCTNLPRPYSRINLVQGTKGMFQGYPNRVYIEAVASRTSGWTLPTCAPSSIIRCGRSSRRWPPARATAAWTTSRTTGWSKCLRAGLPTDMNVYDAAALSAVVELSMQSTTRRSRAMDFPDFTRGAVARQPQARPRWRVASQRVQSQARMQLTTLDWVIVVGLAGALVRARRVAGAPRRVEHRRVLHVGPRRRRGGWSACRWSRRPSAPTRRTSSPTSCAKAASRTTGCGGRSCSPA